MRNTMRAILACCLAPLALAHAGDTSLSEMSEADVAQGKVLFESHCAICHGIGGTGGRGPALTRPSFRRAPDDTALIRAIREGISGTEMPATWVILAREARAVAGYVRSLGRVPEVELPGDKVKGAAIYASNGCAMCHIVEGAGGSLGPELSGVGARRSAAYLLKALVEPGEEVPEGFLVVYAVTADGTGVRGIRMNEDSFTIQLRDLDNQLHSFRKAELQTLRKDFGESVMMSYKRMLDATEIEDLVAYLASLRGEQ